MPIVKMPNKQPTPQEEIFCQFYILTVDAIASAYHAGFGNNIKSEKTLDELTFKERRSLSAFACRALKRPIIAARISELARIHAEKYACATLDEILQYLTSCIRKSKDNMNNINLMNSAIKAVEVLIKRYPEFSSYGDNIRYEFKRG